MYRKLISRAYAIFLMSSLFLAIWYLYLLGIARFFSAFIPVIFSLCLFVFFFITGLRFYKDDANEKNISRVVICLLIQSIQWSVLGVSLINYYGPYLAVGFTSVPDFRMVVKFNLFRFWVQNGYARGNSITLLFNCFQLLLLILFLVLSKRLRQPAETNAAAFE